MCIRDRLQSGHFRKEPQPNSPDDNYTEISILLLLLCNSRGHGVDPFLVCYPFPGQYRDFPLSDQYIIPVITSVLRERRYRICVLTYSFPSADSVHFYTIQSLTNRLMSVSLDAIGSYRNILISPVFIVIIVIVS